MDLGPPAENSEVGSRQSGQAEARLPNTETHEVSAFSAATLKERIHEGRIFPVCEHCQGIWLDRASLEHLIASTTWKSDGSAMSRVRQ